jgi:hypothetical protein
MSLQGQIGASPALGGQIDYTEALAGTVSYTQALGGEVTIEPDSFADYLIDTHGFTAVWPMTDTSGSVCAAHNSAAFNGTYTGVTLGAIANPIAREVGSVAYFSSGTSYALLSSAALTSAFNPAASTLLMFCKKPTLADWTAGRAPHFFRFSNGLLNVSLLVANIQATGFIRNRGQQTGAGNLPFHDETPAAPTTSWFMKTTQFTNTTSGYIKASRNATVYTPTVHSNASWPAGFDALYIGVSGTSLTIGLDAYVCYVAYKPGLLSDADIAAIHTRSGI